ncbi:heme peroxidase [Melampsora americana]|nr:heme peroxidase [Melampsora americana]
MSYDNQANQPKPGEALIQSAGYTHVSQIGSAADLPTLSNSPVWRKVAQFEETVGTIPPLTDPKPPTSLLYLIVQQILGGTVPNNLMLTKNIIMSLGNPFNDRGFQLEQVVAFLSRAGRKRHQGPNKFVNAIQGQFINLLWTDLPHPPTTNLDPKYRFRSADGRDNNLTGLPMLGAANQPYSRSVKPVHPVPAGIAEPEEIFDAIIRRPPGFEGFTPHPAQVSSLFFGFANLIIHDLFWSNSGPEVKTSSVGFESKEGGEGTSASRTSNQWQNKTSSYASLDPLYGTSEQEQSQIRDRSQLGRGLLHNDTFSSNRLLLMPPSSCALLVLFSRNHNRIARKVLELNERGAWQSDLSQLTPEQLQQQDDEIFGTARHVNCAYYAGIILSDYLQAILNTTQVDSNWALDPRAPIKNLLGSTPKATGNSVSVEFNVLYRWHSAISWSQTQWMEDKFSKALPSRNWDEMTGADLAKASALLRKELNAEEGSDPKFWKLSKYETHVPDEGPPELTSEGVYERDPNSGKFRDEDIARILKDSTNEVAGTFGARHVPAAMKWIECQGMRTARDVWKLCTLNEFRAFIGLKQHDTFQEWNSDPSIASAMEDLVGHPSNIPLHVGLNCEEAKRPTVGSGVCLPYTISRAILSDAIALVRGDRFFTDSASADVMTDWGINEVQPDPQNGSFGGLLEKMILPFVVPKHSYSNMQRIGFQKALNYSLNPSPSPNVGFEQFQNDGKTMVCEMSATSEVEVQRMGLIFGLAQMHSNIKLVYKAVERVMSHQDPDKYHVYLKCRIRQCSAKRSPVSLDQTVDILRDVTNPFVSGWLAHIFGLVETGIHSEQLLLCALSDIYCYLTESPHFTYKSRTCARVAASGLAWQIKYQIQAARCPNSWCDMVKKGVSVLSVGALDVLADSIKYICGQNLGMRNCHADAIEFYAALTAENDAQPTRLSDDELAADCLRALSTLAYTIPSEVPSLRATLNNLVKKRSSVNLHEEYLQHGLESARLSHWNPALRGMTVCAEHLERQHGKPIGIIDENFRLDRNSSDYLRLLDVDGYCMPVMKHLLPIIIEETFALPCVRRSPGPQGQLKKVMITGAVASIPTMHIRYEGTQS